MKLTTDDRKALQGAINVLAEILQQSPEVPDTIEQWPERDKHLQGEFWEDRNGVAWGFIHGYWRRWGTEFPAWGYANKHPLNGPWTKTTDPSLPRTWDTLDAVDPEIERATGDYAGTRRELARGELSESGWFDRLKDGPFRNWVELSIDRAKHVTNIREDA